MRYTSVSYEIYKCRKDTIVFDGYNCTSKALDFCLKIKGEERRTANKKIVDYKFQLHAHNGSGFHTWIILNILPCDKHIVDIIKNGKGIISITVFNGYIYSGEKQILQYLIFRRGMTHLNYSLKKLVRTFKLQEEILKTDMNSDEVDGNNYEDEKMSG